MYIGKLDQFWYCSSCIILCKEYIAMYCRSRIHGMKNVDYRALLPVLCNDNLTVVGQVHNF